MLTWVPGLLGTDPVSHRAAVLQFPETAVAQSAASVDSAVAKATTELKHQAIEKTRQCFGLTENTATNSLIEHPRRVMRRLKVKIAGEQYTRCQWRDVSLNRRFMRF